MNAIRFEGCGSSWKKDPDSCTVVVILKMGKLGLELSLVECLPDMHEALGRVLIFLCCATAVDKMAK